jgi:hypothetical protein
LLSVGRLEHRDVKSAVEAIFGHGGQTVSGSLPAAVLGASLPGWGRALVTEDALADALVDVTQEGEVGGSGCPLRRQHGRHDDFALGIVERHGRTQRQWHASEAVGQRLERRLIPRAHGLAAEPMLVEDRLAASQFPVKREALGQDLGFLTSDGTSRNEFLEVLRELVAHGAGAGPHSVLPDKDDRDLNRRRPGAERNAQPTQERLHRRRRVRHHVRGSCFVVKHHVETGCTGESRPRTALSLGYSLSGMAGKPNTRRVEPTPGGRGWDLEDPGRKGGPISHHRTQKVAQQAGRQDLKRTGGGELVTKNVKGRIRAKDTVAPGRDSRKRKG